MLRFNYPAKFTPAKEDGGFVVTFRDLPEAITQGDNIRECLEEASDCLEEAIAARIDDGMKIPVPSKCRKGDKLAVLPLQTALKAALYIAMKEAGISKTELARQLQMHEKEVRRILDPHHGTRLPAMERALTALGKHVELSIV